MHDVELMTYSDAATRLLVGLDLEITIVVIESITVLVHQQRKDSFLHEELIRVIVVATKHEDILASGVTVQICIHVDHSILLRLLDHVLDCSNFRCLSWWILPATIQVETSKAASLVAVDYSVRVQHRHDFKNEVITKKDSPFTRLL